MCFLRDCKILTKKTGTTGEGRTDINIMIIYVIKTMTKCEPVDNSWSEFGHERNVGFYTNFPDAYSAVHNNVCDLWETIYNYAMIEEVEEGLYGSAGMRTWWFKYNQETGTYDEIPIPEFCKNKFGFTIG